MKNLINQNQEKEKSANVEQRAVESLSLKIRKGRYDLSFFIDKNYFRDGESKYFFNISMDFQHFHSAS